MKYTIKFGLLASLCFLMISCLGGNETTRIKKGDIIPVIQYTTVDGQLFNLREEVKKQPAILIYYRGGWCPYCNTQLSELRKIEADILKAGFQILAVSPDKPSELSNTKSKHALGYTVLSDATMAGAQSLGIAYKLPDELIKKYSKYDIDLERSSGESHHLLPHPAVIIIDSKKIVRFVSINEDYKIRLSNADLLDVLSAIADPNLPVSE